jgi:hypothetical protein
MRSRDELAIVAAFLEQPLRVSLLKIAGTDFPRRNVRRDGEHRYTRALAIEEPIDEVQIARATTPRAHREITGQMRLGARRERRDFLMPDMDPLDRALPSYRVGQAV